MEEKIPHRGDRCALGFLFNPLQNLLCFHSPSYFLYLTKNLLKNKHFSLVVVFLAQKEYRLLLKNALEVNSSEAEGFFIHAMNNSFVFLFFIK